jgi:hypothetical protein
MPNGNKTTRDYVIEIHTDMKHINEWKDKHEKSHKFIWVTLITLALGLPPAIFYILKIAGKII